MRTKLVLAFLVITLLPVLPLFYLVEGLLQQSLEIGFNKKVESALEHAAKLSRDLYAVYKQETLRTAEALAGSKRVMLALQKRDGSLPELTEMRDAPGIDKLALYDSHGRLVVAKTRRPQQRFPQLFQTHLRPLAQKNVAGFVEGVLDPKFISVFAPVFAGRERLGFLVATRVVADEFTSASEQVVEVHQMFKTLDFVRDDLKRGFLLVFFVVYAPIAAISVAVGYYFSRRITSSLLHLVKGTQKVAAGDWQYRLQASSRDEVGQLVDAFNQMIVTLKEKQDQVIALEKMAAWREIARILAHEIKNPLTPIQLTVQQMQDQYRGNDPEYKSLLKECSEIVSEEIESLRTLVREFSEFARMPKLNLAPGNLNELIEEVGKLFQSSELQWTLEPTLPDMNFDYEKMRRVLINLIQNGIDSMSGQTAAPVRVETRHQDNQVLLCVSDSGTGITEEMQAKIFEPYFSTKKSGMGLGLAIVKRIVEEHAGEITVESIVGQGTTFQLMFSLT
ncbi:MAG: ATP-binding protein [bacterium]